jgi:hypothetical protein
MSVFRGEIIPYSGDIAADMTGNISGGFRAAFGMAFSGYDAMIVV